MLLQNFALLKGDSTQQIRLAVQKDRRRESEGYRTAPNKIQQKL